MLLLVLQPKSVRGYIFIYPPPMQDASHHPYHNMFTKESYPPFGSLTAFSPWKVRAFSPIGSRIHGLSELGKGEDGAKETSDAGGFHGQQTGLVFGWLGWLGVVGWKVGKGWRFTVKKRENYGCLGFLLFFLLLSWCFDVCDDLPENQSNDSEQWREERREKRISDLMKRPHLRHLQVF